MGMTLVEETRWDSEGLERNLPRDGINMLMSDLVQWLHNFDVPMHRNHTHT